MTQATVIEDVIQYRLKDHLAFGVHPHNAVTHEPLGQVLGSGPEVDAGHPEPAFPVRIGRMVKQMRILRPPDVTAGRQKESRRVMVLQ